MGHFDTLAFSPTSKIVSSPLITPNRVKPSGTRTAINQQFRPIPLGYCLINGIVASWPTTRARARLRPAQRENRNFRRNAETHRSENRSQAAVYVEQRG